MKVKCDIYSGIPYGSAETWVPPKADDCARVLFADKANRIADIIFFRDYPKCCRIRLYGPDLHVVADLFADAPFCSTNQLIPGFWGELVKETLQRGGIVPQEDQGEIRRMNADANVRNR